MGTGAVSGGNRPWRDVDQTPPSSTEVKELSFDISSKNVFRWNFGQYVQISEKFTDTRCDQNPPV
jgi:hypothetical protein